MSLMNADFTLFKGTRMTRIVLIYSLITNLGFNYFLINKDNYNYYAARIKSWYNVPTIVDTMGLDGFSRLPR